jgi:hypothetical protein
MISVVISFRFSAEASRDQSRKKIVDKLFNYWQLVSELFDVELIFINDHSEDFWLQEPFIYPMPGLKKNWNQPAARNYGASLAKGDHLLFTDIDHILYGDFNLLENSHSAGFYFIFPRKGKTNDEYSTIASHKNTFCIKKEYFPGYDEEFCGNYGHDDTEFIYRLNKTYRPVLSENTLTAFAIGLKSVDLPRDTTINKLLLSQKMRIS